MNINEISDEKLKALWYDELKSIKRAESNMAAIDQELARRGQARPVDFEVTKEEEGDAETAE